MQAVPHELFSKAWKWFVEPYTVGWPLMVRSLVLLGIVFAASALIELLAVGWARSSLRKLLRPDASARCDMVAALLLQTPLSGQLGMLMAFGLSVALTKYVAGPLTPWWPSGTLSWLHVIAFIVVVDFFYYVAHRAMHEVPALWHIHRFHHAATDLTLLTGLRTHPLERTFNALVLAVPLALLGGRADDVVAVFIGAQVLSMLRHSGLSWQWGPLGRLVLVSPAAHRAHHSRDPAYFGTNYGILFICWDRLLGTWKAPSATLPPIGLAGDPLGGRGFLAGTWICYRDFLRTLARRPPHAAPEAALTLSVGPVSRGGGA